MTKTSKKFISLMLALMFVLSLVPFSALAEAQPVEAKVKPINPIWIYDNTAQKGNIQNYGNVLQFSGAGTGNYKSFFQLDLSGYEYLLRDDSTVINMSLRGGGAINNISKRLYDYNMYILADKNDAYGDHYVAYSDSTTGMTGTQLKQYVTPLTSESGQTPFIRRIDATRKSSSTTAVISSDANNQILIDALDASTDDSVVTIQIVDGPATNIKNTSNATENYGAFTHNSDLTFLQITCSNPQATPAKYVEDTKTEIKWNMISTDERGDLRSDLNLSALTKYKGIDITWSSSNPAALNAETGAVTRTRQEQNVTLTANLSYTDYNGGVTADTVNFDVTIPAVTLDEVPVFGDTVNEGDTVLGFRSGSAYKPSYNGMESVKEGLGGKGETDAYLVYGDVGGTRELSKATATGAQDVIEYSVYVPSGSQGMSTSIYIDDVNGNYKGETYVINPDGIFVSFSTGLTKIASLTPDKWHTLAFVTPEPYNASSAENDNKLKIYVDGILRTERSIAYGKNGLDYNVRFNSRRVSSSAEPPALYLDNLRVHSNPYAPEYDMLDEISYKDGIDGDVITVKGKTTVAQFKDGITKKADTVIRVYRQGSDVILSDEAYIQHGDRVVAAAKNGSEMERSYNYYTINKIKYEAATVTKVNGNTARIYDADDEIFASSEITNYTDSDNYNVKMFAAQYKYGELINLWGSESALVAPGETKTLSCNFEGIKDRGNSSIKIIFVDDELNPIGKASTMRCKTGDTETTLWVLGDSTVQTYEDKTENPIQGWGFHLPSFLNDNITVQNMAQGGYTSDHYLYPDGIYTREDGVTSAGTELNDIYVKQEHRYKIWANVLPQIKPGDYVIIALGINDSGAVGEGEYRVPKERFIENIETMYNDAVSAGAQVILVTPVTSGGGWDEESFLFPSGRKNFGKYLTNIASSHGSLCLQFGSVVYDVYLDMVDEYLANNEGATKKDAYNHVRNYFHLYYSKGTPPAGYTYSGTGNDSTHHNTVASKHLAKILAELLVESGSPLGDYVVIPQ